MKAAAGSIPVVFANVGDPVATGFVGELGTSGRKHDWPKHSCAGFERQTPGIAQGDNPDILDHGRSLESDESSRSFGSARGPGCRATSRNTAGLNRGAHDKRYRLCVGHSETEDARLIVLPDPLTGSHRSTIIALAAKARMPALYGYREYVDEGGLLAYGPNYRDVFRRGAVYVDKILKGAAPAELPVEQPTKLELVINLKTAKALGIVVPPTLLARADEVIE